MNAKENKTETITIRITPSLKKKIQEASINSLIPINKLIEVGTSEFIDKLSKNNNLFTNNNGGKAKVVINKR